MLNSVLVIIQSLLLMYCQDVSSFCNAPVNMCHLSAMHLSTCVIFLQCTCQHVSSFCNAPVNMCHLSAMHLSTCVIVRQGALTCTCNVCQDVSSFGNAPVKMCHLSAGSSDLCMSLVHVCMLCSMVHCSCEKFTVGFQDPTSTCCLLLICPTSIITILGFCHL